MLLYDLLLYRCKGSVAYVQGDGGRPDAVAFQLFDEIVGKMEAGSWRCNGSRLVCIDGLVSLSVTIPTAFLAFYVGGKRHLSLAVEQGVKVCICIKHQFNQPSASPTFLDHLTETVGIENNHRLLPGWTRGFD